MKNLPLKEAAKEFGRIAVLAVLPLVIAALESGTLFTVATAVTLAVALLRALDAYIHQNKNIKANGLLPF